MSSCVWCGHDVESDQVCAVCGTRAEIEVEIEYGSLFDSPDDDDLELGGES